MTKKIVNLAEDAYIHIQKTADALLNGATAVLKPAGLTPTQYNVLRVLRGTHPDSVTCGELAEQLINKDPDITRLMDRMEARHLISRERHKRDRRHVTIRITDAGLRILKSLDGPIANYHRRQLGRLGSRELNSLIELLEVAKETTKEEL